jgi:hypothetical protein
MKKVADVLWFVVVSASLALLLAAPVMWLWNGLFVDLPAITYGKSLGEKGDSAENRCIT